MNILKKIYSFYKHTLDLYDTKPVTRKEYLLFISLITLLSYTVLVDCFMIFFVFIILVLFAPLLLIATFNRLKNTIISTIPAFILSFLIPYLLLVLNVSTDDMQINIPLENYYNNIFLVYFALLFLSGLILPVSNKNKEITYEKVDKDNKKLNLLHIFNDLITFNLKASINREQYIISFIITFILPIFMFVLSYLLVILLRIFYRSNLNAVNILKGDGPFVLDFFGPEFLIYISFAVCIAVTIIVVFLLFIMRINDITKNLILKLSIITAYIILLASGITILLDKDNLPGIIIYALSLFMIPTFIKGKSEKEETI